MQQRKAAHVAPLLDLSPVRGSNGSPLSLGQQLRRLLQPKTLFALPRLCVHRLSACSSIDLHARILLPRQKLLLVWKHVGSRASDSGRVLCGAFWPLCGDYVRGPASVHLLQYEYD